MKKTYLARRNALVTSTSFTAGAAALLFAVALVLLRVLFPDAFMSAAAPVLQASQGASDASRAFFGSFADKSALTLENDALLEQNAALAAENQALRVELSAIVALEQAPGAHVVPVLAGPPVSPYDVLVVEGGRAEGIAPGFAAFGPGGVPVGLVTDVRERISRVRLFSSPGSMVYGWVGNGIPLEIHGQGGGAMRSVVPKTAGVAEGDVVYVPGPGQLPMGQVARVDTDPALAGATLHIKSAVNLFSLSWLQVRDTGIALDAFPAATSTP